ncbi:MAG: MFS transporter [Planctomycetes bacterium]|nr:MFS transporter [Planctomycetota bacterium]
MATTEATQNGAGKLRGPSSHPLLGVVFLTVFLDIVGFSILFPIFPGMLDHYLAMEGPESLIGRLYESLGEITGGDENAVATLFGGILGSVYGLLQFIFSTVWGSMSDRRGRRPVLLWTLTGTVAAYVLWMFAGGFVLLVLSRVLAGMMAGNISIASAAAADVTDAKSRAKGMGMVGAAIGLGFVCGPAIGAFLPNFLGITGESAGLSTHPYTYLAVASAVMAAINLFWVISRFPETLPEERRGESQRSLNPIARLRELELPGVVKTNWVYFLYLVAFGAAEFTITFLAAESLDYTRQDLGKVFVFIGLVIAFVQGGLVRRLAPKYGERRLIQVGLIATLPSFLLVAAARDAASEGLLYAGLFLMAVGSAFAMPCLSALASRYAPADRQGLALGVLRSMGSLSRAIGPVLGAALYWRFGASLPYHAGAAFLVIPIALALRLPAPPETEA